MTSSIHQDQSTTLIRVSVIDRDVEVFSLWYVGLPPRSDGLTTYQVAGSPSALDRRQDNFGFPYKGITVTYENSDSDVYTSNLLVGIGF